MQFQDQIHSKPISAVDARAERLLADMGTLASTITSRAAEMETGRRIPPDLVETLRSIGAFRLFAPQSYDGLELDLPTALKILSAAARIDGSTGWALMISNGGHLLAPALPCEIYRRIYEDGPDVTFAGSLQPAGTAEFAGSDWRVSGRWPFASGCQHADWMLAMSIMMEGGHPILVGGAPLVRGFVLPAAEWQIEDTWHVAGLKGTGSHHISLENKAIPAANFFDFADGASCIPGPLYQAAQPLLPLLHGAVSVGIAEGALDDLIALATSGRQQLRAATPMRDSEVFQHELGRIAADMRAARAFLETQAASHWRHALAGTVKDEAVRVEGTQAAIWLATTCVQVAGACFTLGGGSALYESSPLQRRLRDLHAAAQHAVAQQRQYASSGKWLLARGG